MRKNRSRMMGQPRTVWITDEVYVTDPFELAAEAMADEWNKVTNIAIRVTIPHHKLTTVMEGSCQTDLSFSISDLEGGPFSGMRIGNIATRGRLVRFIKEKLEDFVAQRTIKMLTEEK